MRVLLTSPYYPPHLGGIENHVRMLAQGMCERGHEVVVVTATGCDERVTITTVPCLPVPYSPIPLKFPPMAADVYHSHIPSPFFARRLMKQHVQPHIVTYHNDIVTPDRVNGKRIPGSIARWIEKKHEELVRPILSDAGVIIATTRSYADTSPLLKDYLEKVAIIPNAISVKDFLPGEDAGERASIVLYSGRLVEYKGLPILIRAMSDLDARLVVLGDGEDRHRFEELARKCEVNAEFRGVVSNSELKHWMRTSRMLVLPAQSRLEAFGIVLLEAMACKTPVIASNIPGVAEVARNGGLVFEDEEELRRHINDILDDDALATALGRKGRENVKQQYDWKSALNKIEALYKRWGE